MRGMGNMGNMQGMMQKVQKMQKEMAKEQAAIEAEIFTAHDTNEFVEAKVNGKKQLVELNLSEQIVDPDDVDMLQDLIIATVNDALKLVDNAVETRLGKYTKGLNLPF